MGGGGGEGERGKGKSRGGVRGASLQQGNWRVKRGIPTIPEMRIACRYVIPATCRYVCVHILCPNYMEVGDRDGCTVRTMLMHDV